MGWTDAEKDAALVKIDEAQALLTSLRDFVDAKLATGSIGTARELRTLICDIEVVVNVDAKD